MNTETQLEHPKIRCSQWSGGGEAGEAGSSAVAMAETEARCLLQSYHSSSLLNLDHGIRIQRLPGTQGWTENEIPSTPDAAASSGHGRRPGSWERARKSIRLRAKKTALTAAAGFSSEHRNLYLLRAARVVPLVRAPGTPLCSRT